MSSSDTLPLLRTTLPEAELIRILGDLHSVIEDHADTLTATFPEGMTPVADALAAREAFVDAASAARRERSQADRALAERTAFHDEAREHIRDIKAKVKRIARHVERDDPPLARQLLKDYAIRGNQLTLTRVSHIERLLAAIVTAHKTHADLLAVWATPPDTLAAAARLADQLPGVATRLRRERSEAEVAVDRRDDLEAAAVRAFNDLITTAEAFQREHPQLMHDMASALAKHHATLGVARSTTGSDDDSSANNTDRVDDDPTSDAPSPD